MFQLKNVKLSQLKTNEGQVEGLPKNPRFIRDERFEALKKSIADAPEMMSLREIIAYDNNGEYVIIGGNMRYRAIKELGIESVSCKILDKDTPVEKLREYVIKDNIEFGQNDDFALQDWNLDELINFGLETDNVDDITDDEFESKFNSINNEDAIYPIIPRFDEKHELFIIVSHSEVDANWFRDKFGLNKMKSYKSNEVIKSNVIQLTDFILNYENSNTK